MPYGAYNESNSSSTWPRRGKNARTGNAMVEKNPTQIVRNTRYTDCLQGRCPNPRSVRRERSSAVIEEHAKSEIV
jgi:hypothetical protein